MTVTILDVHPFPQPQQKIECMILPIQTIFSRRDESYRFDIPQRLHSHMVAIFMKGKGEHFVDFKTYPYNDKTMLFIAQNQVHQWQIRPDVDGLVIAFSKEFLYKSADDWEVLQSYRIFDYSLQSPMLHLDEAQYRRFLMLFLEMKDEFLLTTPDAFKQDILRNLLRTILLRAERLKRAETQSTTQLHYADFVRFKESVEHLFAQTRNVKDYAHTLGYSPKKLNSLTQAILNKGAKSFIDERVLLEIKRLLAHTTLSVQEIAEATGFDEPTNMVKFFKRYMRQTPSLFRQDIQAVAQ
jgi:AraC-like DNA-binding protein